jgi:hypothetical protein
MSSPERPGGPSDVGLGQAGFFEGMYHAGLLGGFVAWPVVLEVVDVHAVRHLLVTQHLRGAPGDTIELLFAEEAAVGGVAVEALDLHFVGLDETVVGA